MPLVVALVAIAVYNVVVPVAFGNDWVSVEAVPLFVWSLAASWAAMALVTLALFVQAPSRRRGGLSAGLKGGLVGGIPGLGLGVLCRSLLSRVFEACNDYFTGGFALPYCDSWRSVEWLLPWFMGLVGVGAGVALWSMRAETETLRRES